jgi:hypothetical protein
MQKIIYSDTGNCSISEAKVGESSGESRIYTKVTFAVNYLKLLAKVEAKVGGESGESGMIKSLILQAAKAKVTYPILRMGVALSATPTLACDDAGAQPDAQT